MSTKALEHTGGRSIHAKRPGPLPPDRLLVLFLLLQYASQAVLMMEWLGGLRIYCRIAAFASSLAMLVLLPVTTNGRHHPARTPTIAMFILMAAGLLHSEAQLLSGFAHWWLVLSIWAPLFWIGRLNITPNALKKVLGMMWLFNILSSSMGVLQVYDPVRFAPSAEFVKKSAGVMADGLLLDLADGRQIFRPFGLSDSPGGAAAAGSFTVITGIALIAMTRGFVVRAAAACGICIGMFCIYICEMRSVLVFTGVSVVVLTILQVLQGRITRSLLAITILPIAIIIAFNWSTATSGERVVKRIASLTEASAGTVYYKSRGNFIENSIVEQLPKYPLGAGLGRYGMMFSYFGDKRQFDARPLYTEVQLTAWLFDGGLLMIVLGYSIMLFICYISIKISMCKNSHSWIADCAALIAGLNVGWLAVTFNYPLFLGQNGMNFVLLNAVLFEAARYSKASNRTATSVEVPPRRNREQLPCPPKPFEESPGPRSS